MKAPLSWLREYVDFDWPAEDLAVRLTALGMEVQSVERVGADWSQVVVGELLEVGPHPSTDRLLLTSVRVGNGPPLSIVCGAHNIAVGQRVPVALPGSVLPGGREIGVSTIAGASSQGMLCSGAELGLTGDAEGILILSADGSEPRIGTPLEDVVGDTVLDVDVKPNRGDALSIVGLAREIAALTGGPLRWPQITVPESGDATSDRMSVTVEAPDLCTRFVGRWVDELVLGPSPLAAQLRLGAAGMRPVSNVVDASNYVMLELGKPIHTFDASAVRDGAVVVRRARDGERIETLDHVERVLASDDLLIADVDGPLGIAGVMGGAGSEVGEVTTAVIIESAIFDPVSIRRSAQRHGLRSEASMRFEKGQEWRLVRMGADRTAQLLADWAGGRPAVGVVDTDSSEPERHRVTFRPARVNRLLGSEIAADEMRDLLSRAEIETEADDGAVGGALTAIVPSHRRDIEIEADVAEEVARLHGYEALPPLLPASQTPPYRTDPRRLVDGMRDMLAARGLSEVLTYVLVSPADHDGLGLGDDDATIRVANPVTLDHSEMRRSLLPGLLRALATNERRRRDDVAVFELGPIHAYADGEPWQSDRLGILLAGNWQPPGWAQPARAADLADVKGIVEWLVRRLTSGRAWYGQAQPAEGVEHPGRTAVVLAGEEAAPAELGRVFELDPRYLRRYEIRTERVAVALLDVDALAGLVRPVRLGSGWRRVPVERDVAVVVAQSVPSGQVEAAIRSSAGEALAELALFDRYQGPPLAPEEVSLAYRLQFELSEGAPSDEEIDAVLGRVAGALRSSLGARIRGAEDG